MTEPVGNVVTLPAAGAAAGKEGKGTASRRHARWAGSPRAVAVWLFVMAAMIAAMVLLGGLTRLTHSGLSMVQWHPIRGVIPPLNHADWVAEFHAYQAYPEYRDVNEGMTLAQFKGIFWLEYFHRLFGRVIGFAFLVPFLWFFFTRRLDRRLAPRLAGIFILGGLQGALGWYMVESGLVNVPHVSHFRLTAHLGLALAIFALILWTAFELAWPERAGRRRWRSLRLGGFAIAALVYVQMLLGGLTAGLHAGLVDNTWPLMDGRIVPHGLWPLTPWWLNPLDNVETVQFDHRMMAYAIVIAVLALFWRVWRRSDMTRRARVCAGLVVAAVLLQASLGIATLLEVVPVPLASMHQGGAVLLFTTALALASALAVG